MNDTPVRRRTVGQVIVTALLALLAANAFEETFWSDGPQMLRIWQAVVCVIAAATAWGAWRSARWSAPLALLYGVVGGAMIVSLGPMLDMPLEERGGLWMGGASILAFSLGCAWYLRRATRRASVNAREVT
jgi:peptidoglycan/LPS O-acetylase OafA/YrhL